MTFKESHIVAILVKKIGYSFVRGKEVNTVIPDFVKKLQIFCWHFDKILCMNAIEVI